MYDADKQLGVGIVGAGIMATVHADAVAHHPAARVTAVTSRRGEQAERLADSVGARVLPSVDDLLSDPDVQVVCIATPDHTHGDLAVAAARAGKHLIIEKPFTTSIDDADRAVDAVRRAGVKAMVLFNHRWVPAYAQAQQRIRAGDIGEPRIAYARKNDTIEVPTDMIRWAADTTCSWFLSSHDIDLVSWMMQDRAVSAYATAVSGVLRGRGIDTPDGIQAQVRYSRGAVATFESCWIYPDTFPTMTDSFVELIGTEGVVHLDRKAEQIEIATQRRFEYPRNLLVRSLHGQPAGAVRDAIWHLLDCVLYDREPLVTLASSRDVTAVLSAIHTSIDTGDVVEVPPSPSTSTVEATK